MKTQQAQKFCDELNGLDIGYVADIEPIKSRSLPGHPCGMRVRHAASGNEVAFAATADEARYIIGNMKRKLADADR